MRKRLTYLLATVLVPGALLLAGIGETLAQVQTRTLRFPSASNKGHPQVQGVEKFAELVAQKSGGKITVRPFPRACSPATSRKWRRSICRSFSTARRRPTP
jgi:TRAP-type C4-dicarboxylate transport system substrate-binding protein